ncbi:MAG: hypothetical protein ABI477_16365 [Chryseolinea sp.]
MNFAYYVITLHLIVYIVISAAYLFINKSNFRGEDLKIRWMIWTNVVTPRMAANKFDQESARAG